MATFLSGYLALDRHSDQGEIPNNIQDLVPDKFIVESQWCIVKHAVRRKDDRIVEGAPESKVCLSQHFDLMCKAESSGGSDLLSE